MWSLDPATSPYKQTTWGGEEPEGFDDDPRPNAGWIDPEVHSPHTVSQLPDPITRPVIYRPPDLTLDQANQHLQYGYYETFSDTHLDPRLRLGEFVMIYQKNENGTTSLIKVRSPAYEWREGVRNNDPNLYHNFFLLANAASIRPSPPGPAEIATYSARFPSMTPYTPNQLRKMIKSGGPIVVWPQTDIVYSLSTRDDRLRNIWAAYIAAVPLHRQLDVIGMYDQYFQDRHELVEWLYSLEEIVNISHTEVQDRIKKIIAETQKYAQERQSLGRNVTRTGKKLSVEEMTRENISMWISREEGSNLYRLQVKGMKAAKAAKVAAEAKAAQEEAETRAAQAEAEAKTAIEAFSELEASIATEVSE